MSEPNASAPYDDGAATPPWRERKNMLIAGGAVGAVVLGLGAYFLVFAGGGSSDASSGLVPNAHHNTGAHPVSTAAAAAPDATVPAVYKADPYADPFKPLYAPTATSKPSAPPASTTTTDTSTSSGSGSAASSGSGSTSGSTGSGSSASSGSGSTSGSGSGASSGKTTTKTYKIRLDSVTGANAQVTVNGATLTVVKNQQFSNYFAVVALWPDEDEVTLSYGDSRFTMDVGHTYTIHVTA